MAEPEVLYESGGGSVVRIRVVRVPGGRRLQALMDGWKQDPHPAAARAAGELVDKENTIKRLQEELAMAEQRVADLEALLGDGA